MHFIDHCPEDADHSIKHVIPSSLGFKLLECFLVEAGGARISVSVSVSPVGLGVDLACSRVCKLDILRPAGLLALSVHFLFSSSIDVVSELF